ncbi:hypothetical protein J1605_013470 [Eschrichtius robustus]|uniref:Checkpoint protein HUS1 n=1 Tax=Eschrichtius robustus TaxID=9764 RepID=A0AB34GI71_ESCRO|nr:hypothetical protein J1605_013470 [Eschrichtius robustus]
MASAPLAAPLEWLLGETATVICGGSGAVLYCWLSKMLTCTVLHGLSEDLPGFRDGQIIEANLNGELNLKIETELVCVTTHFKDLGNPPLASENASQDRNSEQMAQVHIDIRKLLQFLAGQQVNPTKATCNIVKNKIVHFDLLHEDVSLQYFIPALS